MRVKLLILLAAFVVVSLASASRSEAQGGGRRATRSPTSSGSLCLAPAARPTAGEKSLSNATGGNRISVYSIQVGDKPAVVVSNERGTLVSGLSRGQKHLVKIKGDGRQVESFSFSFADYSSNRLCLFFNPLYETWSLWKAKDGGAKCRCG